MSIELLSPYEDLNLAQCHTDVNISAYHSQQ